jgi:hypothetical protein
MFDLHLEEATPLHELDDSFTDRQVSLQGGMVLAYIAATKNKVTIYSWWSIEEGCGNSTRALKELRARFNFIFVSDACAEEFWYKMLDRNLIDNMDGETKLDQYKRDGRF